MTGAPDYQRRVEHLEELGVVRQQLGRLLAPIGDDDLSFNAVIAADELLANCFVHTDDGCSIAAWLDHNPRQDCGSRWRHQRRPARHAHHRRFPWAAHRRSVDPLGCRREAPRQGRLVRDRLVVLR